MKTLEQLFLSRKETNTIYRVILPLLLINKEFLD